MATRALGRTTYGYKLSETWLKDNADLLEYVQIPGYTLEYLNRDKIKGSDVWYYINELLTFKRRKDIENLADIEHLHCVKHAWIRIKMCPY